LTARDETGAPPALDLPFDAGSLAALRSATQAHVSRAGMPADRATDMVIGLHELAANAVRHGAGSGRLQIWDHDGALRCHVDDDGPQVAGQRAAGSDGQNLAARWPFEPGHGLWLARQVADQMLLRSDQSGTKAVLIFTLPAVAGGESSGRP
jgi:anti-sigma regulatory factor (Ser/Thr protein kinase)